MSGECSSAVYILALAEKPNGTGALQPLALSSSLARQTNRQRRFRLKCNGKKSMRIGTRDLNLRLLRSEPSLEGRASDNFRRRRQGQFSLDAIAPPASALERPHLGRQRGDDQGGLFQQCVSLRPVGER